MNLVSLAPPGPEIYRKPGYEMEGSIQVEMPLYGNVKENDQYINTNLFNIAFTEMGNKGPIVAFLHGVPGPLHPSGVMYGVLRTLVLRFLLIVVNGIQSKNELLRFVEP